MGKLIYFNFICHKMLPVNKHTAKTFYFCKRYCTSKPNLPDLTNLKLIPHQFNTEEAIKKFDNHDNKRIFKPIAWTQNDITHLKKVFIPYVFAKGESKGKYTAQYGITRSVRCGKHTYHYTNWYNIANSLPLIKYNQNDGLKLYTGYTYENNLIEEIMCDPTDLSISQFLSKHFYTTIDIDPFLMDQEQINTFIDNKIYKLEEQRASNHIYAKSGADKVYGLKLDINYTKELSYYLLPIYVLQKSDEPPRILPAYNKDSTWVYGSHDVSITKTMITTAVMGTVLSLVFPQFAIPIRLASIGSSITSGIYVGNRLSWINKKQNYYITDRKNKEVDTQKINQIINNHILNEQPAKVEPKLIEKQKELPPFIIKHLQILDLTENDLSMEKINMAYKNVNKTFKSNRDMIRYFQEAKESKDILTNYIKNKE